jgi:hypothetical protein
MSRKKLQVEEITNELEGASLFFNQPTNNSTEPLIPEPEKQLETPLPEPVIKTEIQSPVLAEIKKNNAKIGQVRNNASKQASIVTNKHDSVEAIRKTVKQVGKEVFFIRVTPEEKHTLGSIVYSFNEIYRGEGRKTSENEVGRIALNFLLEDYQENGNNSVLARVLAAINA